MLKTLDRPMRRLSLALLILAVAGRRERQRKPERPTSPPTPTTLSQQETKASFPQYSYAEVVERVGPGVVTIRSERRVRAPRQHPFFNDPRLGEHFGGRFGGAAPAVPRVQMGLGSGVIVRPQGYVLTNHHVIDGAEEIKIELSDRRIFNAKMIGSDPPSDLAVLKIESKDLAALSLGDSDRVRVGDIALAIGNPLGLGQTVTAGIISAKGRATGLSDGSFEDFSRRTRPSIKATPAARWSTVTASSLASIRKPFALRREHRHWLCHSFKHGAQRHGATEQNGQSRPRPARNCNPTDGLRALTASRS